MNDDARGTGALRPTVKCLLVDDLDENLLAMSALLRGDDVELLPARSGREALELLLRHDVALAVVDVQMPDMDGFQLAELMRGAERTRAVPIIFVTAGSRDPQRLFKGYDTGAVDFLFKPIEPHILRSKAEVFFQLHRHQLRLALELEQRSETLRLNEMFSAVLGHDLRAPLSAFALSAEVLKRRPDEATRKLGERLAQSAQWMARMIDDMLDLARSRLGDGIPLRRRRIDLAALVRAVIAERQAAFPERRIEIDAAGDSVGEWDEDRLLQVVSNLVCNAIHHGDPDDAIEVRIDGDAFDRLRLTVSNGGRIAADELPHVFAPFRSGARPTGHGDGLGLGLYIVQQIVQAHGGGVDVACGDDGRTRFSVCLPRSAAGFDSLLGAS